MSNLTNNGYTPKVFEDVYNDILNIFKNIFGDNFNSNPASVNGLFIQELANIGISNEDTKTEIYSGIYNPNLAQGVFLDSLCALLGLQRKSATQSQVNCQLVGLPQTVIPSNIQAISTNGDVFILSESVTLDSNGYATGLFFSQNYGPINCDANTITTIATSVGGLYTINNVDTGILGTNIQNDTELRNARTNLLSLQSSGSIGSIKSYISTQEDVINVYAQENSTNEPITIGGVTIPGHNIYVAVLGGTDETIAKALFYKKAPGIPMTGNTSGTYIDQSTGTEFNYTFQRPVETPITIEINTYNSPNNPSNIEETVINEIYNNFYGLSQYSNLPRIGIYDTINISRFFYSLYSAGITLIQSITINKTLQELQLSADKIATLSKEDITVNFLNS